ncbi:replication protein RepA [Pseudomonas protegens]|uniref:replication protein RepA n=1 Tax=Pseudomonas protegens TaxID=380021 RepID=UPI0023EC3690|nr:replication protein RepA [Pseudomonas protegens]MDF4211139.1 replication protein RepA [Pseudomonas protegens]
MTEVVPLGRRIDSMIRESLAIEYEDAKSAGMLGYMARSLVQATLPHTDPKQSYFERTNGLVTLSIVSRPTVGIPYGSVPRSLLAWICSEAVLTKNKELDLGRSQSEFLRKLGMANDGNYISSMKKQAQRLFSSLITVSGNSDSDIQLDNVVIAKRACLFWNPKRPDERSLWESTLTLNTDFFEEVTSSPVPVDLRVLHHLRQSPLAMDIYTWSCYRQFLLKAKGQGMVKIPWGALKNQFGSNYGGHSTEIVTDEKTLLAKNAQAVRNFKHKFMKRMAEVGIFYPELVEGIEDTPQFLIMKSVKLHVPPQFKVAISV